MVAGCAVLKSVCSATRQRIGFGSGYYVKVPQTLKPSVVVVVVVVVVAVVQHSRSVSISAVPVAALPNVAAMSPRME